MCTDYWEGHTKEGWLPLRRSWVAAGGGVAAAASFRAFWMLKHVDALTVQKTKMPTKSLACPSPHTLQASCSATRLPGDGQTSTGATSLQEPPSYPPVQVIRARVSSSSSSQVSSINSDLEVGAVSAGRCTGPPSPVLAGASVVPALLCSPRPTPASCPLSSE